MRKIFILGAIAALSPGLLVQANRAWAGQSIDVSQDKITCNTVTGSVKIAPALNGTPQTITVAVKGTLDGCTDTTNSAVRILASKFKGAIQANSADCLSLSGSTSGTGTITIKWKSNSLVCTGGTNQGQACAVATAATDCPGMGGGTCAAASLEQKESTINVTALNGGTFMPGGAFGMATYGSFSLGGPTVTGAFAGTDGGATSTSTLITGQDIVPLAGACFGPGLKAITLGIGTITLQ